MAFCEEVWGKGKGEIMEAFLCGKSISTIFGIFIDSKVMHLTIT